MKLSSIGSIGLRGRLLALLTLAMLPLAVAVAAFVWTDHRQTINVAKSGVLSAAKLAAATESKIFDETRALLSTLAMVPVVTPAGGDACSSFIARIKNVNPLYNTIGVVDAEGGITCHNSLRARQGLTDVALVERMKADGAAPFQIGNFVIGRVSGKPTVIAAQRFPTGNGSFTGIVFAGLNLERMTIDAGNVSNGGQRSVILLEPGSDRLLIHYPPLPGVAFGTPFPDDALMRAVRTAEGDGTAEVPGIDGIDRVYGFTRLPNAPTIVLAVGEDRETLMAPVRQRLLLSASGFLSLLTVACLLVWWLGERMQLRPIQRLIDMARRIAAGKFDVTAALEKWQAPEFRRLGRILEELAAKLSIGRQAEAIVAASEARFRILAENTADLITCSDASGRRIYVSPASRDVVGYEPEELLGKRPRDLAHPDDVRIVDSMMAEALAGRTTSGIQYRVAHRDGDYRWAEVAGKPLGTGAGTVFVLRDVTARKRMEKALEAANLRLEALASTDGLTGLANRRALDERLETEFARATRGKTDLGFLLIDVDNFKAFNDTYGHQAGDNCLRRIAAALQASLRRPGDLTARYGGEELAAILPATDGRGAGERGEEVRRAVRALGIPHSGSTHGIVTVSIGVSTLEPGGDLHDVAGLILAADRALYEAKALGRDRVVGTPAWKIATY